MNIKIINTSTDSIKIANKIAESLVKQKLSPCVQVLSKINSIYRWDNNIKISNEYLLIVKSIPENVQRCIVLIEKLHNYDVPEMIVIDSKILNNGYSDWFVENS